ncbi:MAG: hypothetical protein CMH57_12790 [Myxococcales bacterium]|nr:hypothetical protein [Myxococcales bacterium]
MPSPVHASTVVLLREREEDGRPTVFLVKRHSKSGFMANAYVYPGGKLDPEDTTAEAASFCTGLTLAGAADALVVQGERLEDDAELSPSEALGLHIAAIREMFEEAGVLLAHTASGELVSFADPDTEARFTAHRAALNAGSMSMTDLARAEGLRFPLDTLRYFAHWITPVFERRRFNTRFYLARAPEGQEGLHDNREVVASAWWTPAEALRRYADGEIQLSPPTFRTLEDMSSYTSVDALIAGMTRAARPSVMPRMEEVGGLMTLLLPGDPLHPSAVAVEGSTRLVYDDGRWWSR